MGKHAFLVIAHKYDDTFKTLMKMLDYKDNDIFLHMDIKCKEYDKEEITKSLKYSNLYHTKRTNVKWSELSQVNSELLLLELATSVGKYEYYHLLSGQDLPIITQKDLHERLKGDTTEYLEVIADEMINPERVWYFHRLGKKGTMRDRILKDRAFVAFQGKIGIKRNRKLITRKGSNWFSITDDLARLVVSKRKWVKRVFSFSSCADELFIQTIVYGSDFWNRLAKDPEGKLVSVNKREIDWVNCNGMNPHVYDVNDLERLKNSDNFFARKFDCASDMEIINKIFELYKNTEERND